MMTRLFDFRALCVAVALLAVGFVPDVLAQAPELGRQSLRPYWHVFIAYALVIVILGGWALSIGRRMKDLEKRLVD